MYAQDEKDCIIGNYPTLFAINQTYGKGASEEWLTYVWTSLSEYAGNKGKLTDYQLREMAISTVMDFGFLKITEIMLFCRRVKAGKFKNIFGVNVDPLQLMTYLETFVEERNIMLSRYEQEEREERERKEREQCPPMSYQEWCARHGRTPKINPLKFTTT